MDYRELGKCLSPDPHPVSELLEGRECVGMRECMKYACMDVLAYLCMHKHTSMLLIHFMSIDLCLTGCSHGRCSRNMY